jgi:hypothetical protein
MSKFKEVLRHVHTEADLRVLTGDIDKIMYALRSLFAMLLKQTLTVLIGIRRLIPLSCPLVKFVQKVDHRRRG